MDWRHELKCPAKIDVVRDMRCESVGGMSRGDVNERNRIVGRILRSWSKGHKANRMGCDLPDTVQAMINY